MPNSYSLRPHRALLQYAELAFAQLIDGGLMIEASPAWLLAKHPRQTAERFILRLSATSTRRRKSLKILDLLLPRCSNCRERGRTAPAISQQRRACSLGLDKPVCSREQWTLPLPNVAGNGANALTRADLQGDKVFTPAPTTLRHGGVHAYEAVQETGRIRCDYQRDDRAMHRCRASERNEKNFEKNRAVLCETDVETGFFNERSDTATELAMPLGKRTCRLRC